MNIKKLVEMAREENPNQQLAKLSTQWAEQNKLGNPVRNAISLWHWRWFMGIDITFLLLWITITIVCQPHPSVADKNPTLWFWILMAIVAPLFISVMSDLEESRHERRRDAKRFIEALTVLDIVLGKPIEQWTDEDDPQEKATAYLKDLASVVKVAEEIEKEETKCMPWVTPSVEKQSSPKRDMFNSTFELLTTILPLPKKKGFYYSNEASASTEVPAAS